LLVISNCSSTCMKPLDLQQQLLQEHLLIIPQQPPHHLDKLKLIYLFHYIAIRKCRSVTSR